MYPDFNAIKMQYSWGTDFMTDSDVADYVSYGTITADQYKAITGEAYVAPTTQATTTSTTN